MIEFKNIILFIVYYQLDHLFDAFLTNEKISYDI